jgi:hypothetical protein
MLTFTKDGPPATAELLRTSRAACASTAALVSATRARIASGRRRLNPAWGFSGASDDPRPAPSRRGVIVGPLREACTDHILIGEVVVFLSDGAACRHRLGAHLQVLYTDRGDGRRIAESITALPADRL